MTDEVLVDLKKNECVFDIIGLDDDVQDSDSLKVPDFRIAALQLPDDYKLS